MKLPLLSSLFLTGSLSFSSAELKSDFSNEESISKIAFGSCNNPSTKKGFTPIFDTIIAKQPDVFVFLGDNIYGDTKNMNVLKAKYQELEDVDDFRKLRESTQLIATWDDHDYGVNDGGNTYSKREDSQAIFLDFFKEPADSPRRTREGIYTSYTFGPKGKFCQIILLDTRYFRDPLKKNKKSNSAAGWYSPTKDASMTLLGEDQWKWLEQQLQVSANLRIIASSIQLLAFEKGMENWGNVPHEQQRLFDLLKKHKAEHTFAISGDVHFAELSKKDIGGYPFYDLTSSGITHTHKAWADMDNSFRVGAAYSEKNAGLIQIDWTKKSVSLEIFNGEGETVLQHPIKFDELTFETY